MYASTWRKPSAWLPVAMSLVALGVVLSHVAVYGIVREADEGAAAHIWQILMAGQVPIILYFMFRWLPRAPKRAVLVLVLQAVLYLASLSAVFFLT